MTRVLLLLALAAALVYFLMQQQQNPLPLYGEPDASGGDSGSGLGLGFDFGSLLSDVTDSVNKAIGSVTGGASASLDTVVSVWADAIQRFEGYFVGSRSYRDKNPGNLEPPGKRADFYQGQIGLDGPYAVFDSYASGRRALEMDIRIKLNRLSSSTIYEVMSIYAPPSENPTQQYADYVANALGVTSQTLVSQIAG